MFILTLVWMNTWTQSGYSLRTRKFFSGSGSELIFFRFWFITWNFFRVSTQNSEIFPGSNFGHFSGFQLRAQKNFLMVLSFELKHGIPVSKVFFWGCSKFQVGMFFSENGNLVDMTFSMPFLTWNTFTTTVSNLNWSMNFARLQCI